MATQNRHLNTPKKPTLDEGIATDMAINIIAIHHLKFYLKKLSKNVATCLTLTENVCGNAVKSRMGRCSNCIYGGVRDE